ncbi:MAG: hypothetical protein O7E52_16230 [Candidatus Poribacteria bacterium]|nr:hypothetical protein [Candidatus Poribacteria bacterium]
MAKKRKSNRKLKRGDYPPFAVPDATWRTFTSTDFAWLKAEFQKQIEMTPDLTLEEFAIRQGVQPELIQRFSDTDEECVTVWHGTTADCARSIMAEGFSTLGNPQKKIWFTRKPDEANGYAKRKSGKRGQAPVVFKCIIDLGKYPDFERSTADRYAFRHPRISRDVIHHVSNLKSRIQPDLMKRFSAGFNRGNAQIPATHLILWYGTTTDRAKVIMTEGFKTAEKSDAAIRFTRKSREAHSIAKRESKGNGTAPVVFRCEIDLGEYPDFERPKPHHYAFRYFHISKDVIREVFDLETSAGNHRLSGKKDLIESIDIMITKTSGQLGILSWINHYLKLKGGESINEDHPAVEAIVKWVEAQYAAGRDAPISNEEMSAQVERSGLTAHLNGEV